MDGNQEEKAMNMLNDKHLSSIVKPTTDSGGNPTASSAVIPTERDSTTMAAPGTTTTAQKTLDKPKTMNTVPGTGGLAAATMRNSDQSSVSRPNDNTKESNPTNLTQQSAIVDANSGNDRVTVDKSHEPLVPTGNQSLSQPQPPTKPAAPTPASAPSSAKDPKEGPTQTPKTPAVKTDPTKIPSNSSVTKAPEASLQLDEQTLLEEAIKKERAPLVDRYAPYIIPSDTTLEEARSRLRIAIEQTRQLRAAFTERVYGKYRVCLIPPATTEAMLTRILTDPKTAHVQLEEHIKESKAEKEIEKKEAQKLNAEMVAATTAGSVEGSNTPNPLAAVNAENAEQLMYVSAGLSAIILPEQDVVKDKIDTSSYPDRGPINPETGQRVRSISAAAAAAGEVMLDRARKGAAMRAERHRRKQLQLKAGNDGSPEVDNNYSRLLILSNSPAPPMAVPQPKPTPPANPQSPTTPVAKPAPKTISATTTKALLATKPFKKPAPPKPSIPASPTPASAKAIRARVQASMSLNMLLSLNPSAEDLDGKPSAATKAMIERGVAPHTSNSKTNQQRFRHPFPESLGGRRGALASGQIKKDGAPQETFLHPSYSSLALPPIPTPRERRTFKPVPLIDGTKAGSNRAKAAINQVLDQFRVGADGPQKTQTNTRPYKRRITEISFLHGIHSSTENVVENGSHSGTGATADTRQDIDPILAFNVLHAVGLIRQSSTEEDATHGTFGKDLDPSLFDNAEKGAMSGEDGCTTRRALSKLRRLCKKFTSSKRSFTDAFGERTESSSVALEPNSPIPAHAGRGEDLGAANALPNHTDLPSSKTKNDVDQTSTQAPPIVSIRGGGEVMMGSKDGEGKSGQGQGPGQQPKVGGNASGNSSESRRDQSAQDNLQAQRSNVPMNLPTGHLAQQGRPGMVWEDSSRQSMALMNPRLVEQSYALTSGNRQNVVGQHTNGTSNAPRNSRMPGQIQSAEQFHHHSTANALQLAHHLRHATSSMSRLQQHGLHAGGDLADYIGGLHSQPAGGYDWSTIGAASHSQLAALGIHQHRAAMMNFSVQDRTRALIAREQQNAAAAAAAHAHRQSLTPQQAVNFLGGAANHGYPPGASPHFPHMTGPAAALLNSSALMSHHGMPQVPTPAQVQSAARVHSQQDQRLAQQRTDQKGKKESKTTKDLKREQGPVPKADQAKRPDQSKEGEKPQPKTENPPVVAGSKRDNTTLGDTVAAASPAKKQKVPDSPRNPAGEEKLDSQNEVGSSLSSAAASKDLVQNASAMKSARSGASTSENIASDDQGSEVPPPKKTSEFAPTGASSPPVTADKAETGGKPTVSDPTSKPASAKEKSDPDPNSSTKCNTVSADVNAKTPGPPAHKEGLQFFVPPAPPVLPAEAASLVLAARSHEAIDLLDTGGATCDAVVLVDYLLAVGSAVPIPKALVAHPLKERLGAIVVKNNPIGTFPAMSREAIVASVLLWLWRSHEDCFQKAFAKNGRIDVDPGCKWLINAAVNKAVEAISKEIRDSASRAGNQLTAALLALKNKSLSTNKHPPGPEMERLSLTSTKLDLLTISIVGRALMSVVLVDNFANSLLPHFDDLLSYLDETRKYVLFSKSQERVFLANLISRKATMSLPFSHAYVSSMVRAGEALGHGEFFEVVQNEEVNVSTNIPYDVFTDESGAWEDPCRPPEGYSQGLTGDDLMRRAHARAMIQKSLKKLQDRHNIRGGTSHPGPYVDPPSSGTGAASDSGKSYSGSGTSTTARGWVKRRSSFSEPPVQAGTGSAAATSWSLYDPRHYSAPLVWKSDVAENSPYGRHNKNKRPRSLSVSQGATRGGRHAKGKGAGRSMSVSSMEQAKQDNEEGMRQSTREIAWADVANIFQSVKLPGSAAAQKEKEARAALRQKTIFAPFVRKVELDFEDMDSESDEDEDLRDETVLSRHQVVLDRMKEKLSAVFDARKKTQDRRKSRDKAN